MLDEGYLLKERYETGPFIARGLASLVYTARDVILDRRVLLKKLDPPVGSPAEIALFTRRFREEALLLSGLSHTSLPRMMDFFQSPEGVFQVVESIPGRSLEKVFRKNEPMPLSETVRIGRRLLEILLFLHRNDPRIIHRNVIPTHLILNRNNLFLVNLSSAIRQGAPPDGFYGTPGYAAPEQYPGGSGATKQSDIYSAAVVIHQALTGFNPLDLDSGRPPPPVKTLRPDAPEELANLIDSALAPDPDKRLKTAAQFLTGLSLVKSILEDTRKCPVCGQRDPADSFFCTQCGHVDEEFEKYRFSTGKKFEINFEQPDDLYKEKGRLDNAALYPDALVTSRFLGFDSLITIDHNKIDEYPHQVRAVRKALKEMGARCILADEVGLGKTIEAGIVMEELKARGLINSVLIVTPAHLRFQWKEEMLEKFDTDFKIYLSRKSVDFKKDNRVIISFSAAGRRGKTRNEVLSRTWDLVIVDEAHHARNQRTLRWSFLDSVKKNYILLLSATPVQNSLADLFNLVTILKPGHLSNIKNFKKEFVDPENPRKPKNTDRMKSLVSRVMIRTRRADAMIQFPRRIALTRQVPLQDRERRLYDDAFELMQETIRLNPDKRPPLMYMSLQQALTSSPVAAAAVLKKFSQNEKYFNEAERSRWHQLHLLAEDAGEPSKTAELMNVIYSANDRVLLFSSHRKTQDFLLKYLRETGTPAEVYRGRPKEKKAALVNFEKKGGVLIAGRSGGEGLNLQHLCNILVNYDLPWNPMKIEQRIGRLQRLGQTRDVYVFNLAALDTIESYVIQVLEEKIRMFHLAVGQLDLILGTKYSEEGSFENLIWKKIIESDDGKIRDRILSIGEEFNNEIKNLDKISESGKYLDSITASDPLTSATGGA